VQVFSAANSPLRLHLRPAKFVKTKQGFYYPAKFVKRSRVLLQSGSTLAKQSLTQQGYGGLGPLNSFFGTIPAKFVKRSRALLSCEVCKTKQGLLQSGSSLAKQSLTQQGYGGLGPLLFIFFF
jgi:hypothetical protein